MHLPRPSGRGGDFGEVPEGDHLVPFGNAPVLREGHDVTVVAIGRMVKLALKSAEALASTRPAWRSSIRDVVPARHGDRPVIGGQDRPARDRRRGAASAAARRARSAVVAEQGFDLLGAPIRRVTTANVAIPYAPNAEAHVLPDESRIEAAVRDVLAARHGAAT